MKLHSQGSCLTAESSKNTKSQRQNCNNNEFGIIENSDKSLKFLTQICTDGHYSADSPLPIFKSLAIASFKL
jgi:hypothetical protein